MNTLCYEAIQIIFSVSEKNIKYDYKNQGFKYVIERVLYTVTPEEGYYDDATSYGTIVDECVERENTFYIKDYYKDIIDCNSDYKEKYPNTDVLDFDFGKKRIMAAVYKDKTQDTAAFLKIFKLNCKINPDYEQEINDAIDEIDEAIKEMERERPSGRSY